jgi:hypothetical protein
MTHSSMWRSLLLLTSTVRALNSPFLYARASSSLNLVKNRGLEERRDGATPQGIYHVYCSVLDVWNQQRFAVVLRFEWKHYANHALFFVLKREV